MLRIGTGREPPPGDREPHTLHCRRRQAACRRGACEPRELRVLGSATQGEDGGGHRADGRQGGDRHGTDGEDGAVNVEPRVGLGHSRHADREPPRQCHRDDDGADHAGRSHDRGAADCEGQAVVWPQANGSERVDVVGPFTVGSRHGLPDDEEGDEPDECGRHPQRDRQRTHRIVHLPLRRHLVRHEDRSTSPKVLLSAQCLDGGGQLGEISARCRVDERAFEVPIRPVDQRGERARGQDRTRLVEVAEGHNLVVENADSGHLETDGMTLIRCRDRTHNLLALRLVQQNTVDVVADKEVLERRQPFAHQDLVSSRRIRHAAGNQPRPSDVGAPAAVERGNHTDPRRAAVARLSDCVPFSGTERYASDQPDPGHAWQACHRVIERFWVGAWASRRRDEQLRRIGQIEEDARRPTSFAWLPPQQRGRLRPAQPRAG